MTEVAVLERFCLDHGLASLVECIKINRIDSNTLISFKDNIEGFFSDMNITIFGEKVKWRKLFDLVVNQNNRDRQDYIIPFPERIKGNNELSKALDSDKTRILFNENPNANPDAAKNILQHICIHLGLAFPEYAQRIVGGNAHQPLWSSKLTIVSTNGQTVASINGIGNSKKDADKNAAMQGIAALKVWVQKLESHRDALFHEAIEETISNLIPNNVKIQSVNIPIYEAPILPSSNNNNVNMAPTPEEMIENNDPKIIDNGLLLLLASHDVISTKSLIQKLSDLLNFDNILIRRKVLILLTQLGTDAVSCFPQIILNTSKCLYDGDFEIQKGVLRFYLRLGKAPSALGADCLERITTLSQNQVDTEIVRLSEQLLRNIGDNPTAKKRADPRAPFPNKPYRAPTRPDVIVLIDVESVPDSVKKCYWSNLRVIGFLGKNHQYAQENGILVKNVMEVKIIDSSGRDAADHMLTFEAGRIVQMMDPIRTQEIQYNPNKPPSTFNITGSTNGMPNHHTRKAPRGAVLPNPDENQEHSIEFYVISRDHAGDNSVACLRMAGFKATHLSAIPDHLVAGSGIPTSTDINPQKSNNN
jgi:hypothetical protein